MREWFLSRSFLELQKSLALKTEIETNDEAVEAIASLLKRTMETDKNRELTFTCAALMIEKSDNIEWLVEAFKRSEKINFLWGDIGKFTEFICGFPGKKLVPIMGLTLEIMGLDWLADLTVELPIRLWKSISTTLSKAELSEEPILDRVVNRFNKKQATCDQIIWLWKSKVSAAVKAQHLTHTNLFITVSRPVVKHYIKARTQLIELIMNNDKFLGFLVDKGDAKKVKSFLEHLKTYGSKAGIDEKKMMIRIAELFPKAKKNIEKSAVKSSPKVVINSQITSVSSYTLYQQKLKDIIEEIPKNKEQIQRAREFGDFSENSELDAAKERRDYLLARQTELKEALDTIQAVDFTEMKFEGKAMLGSSVTLDVEGDSVTYHLLGCWDSNPDRNMLSSGAELTKVLFGKKEKAKVTLPNKKKAVVTAVKPLDAEIAKLTNTRVD